MISRPQEGLQVARLSRCAAGGIGASLSAVINESLFDELDHEVCSRQGLFAAVPDAGDAQTGGNIDSYW